MPFNHCCCVSQTLSRRLQEKLTPNVGLIFRYADVERDERLWSAPGTEDVLEINECSDV